jgi:hypothetical protein
VSDPRAEAKRLLEAITPGEWESVRDTDGYGNETGFSRVFAGESGIVDDYISNEDADFIAKARPIIEWYESALTAQEQRERELLEALHGLQTEDGCYCATGDGNPHSVACLAAQRVIAKSEGR